MAKSKKKGEKKAKGKGKNKKGDDSKLITYCTYIIALLDSLSAITILALAFKMIISSFSWSSIFLLIFAIFWTTVLMMLIFGIWKNRPNFVRSWIIFSCVVIVFETFLVIYGAFKEATINSRHMKSVILLLLGLILESIFVYIVYLFTKQITCECGQKKKGCALCRKKDPNCKKVKKKKKSKK